MDFHIILSHLLIDDIVLVFVLRKKLAFKIMIDLKKKTKSMLTMKKNAFTQTIKRCIRK